MAGGLLERANAIAERGGGCFYRSCLFNFGDEGGSDYSSVREAAENGHMAGKRDPEADRDGKPRDAASSPEEGGEIIGQGVLSTSDAGTRNKVEKSRGAAGDLRKALVRGSRRAEKDSVEMVRGEDAAIVFGLFGREVSSEDAVSAIGCSSGCEFLEAHLQNGIVVAEEDERNLR